MLDPQYIGENLDGVKANNRNFADVDRVGGVCRYAGFSLDNHGRVSI